MNPAHPVAFVLGGGGVLGAHEVGMLRALVAAGVAPDVVLGTSVGAINGAVVAARGCSAETIERLTDLWRAATSEQVFTGSAWGRVGTLARSGTHLHSAEPLRRLLADHLPVQRIQDLPVRFECVASSIERAGAHWFTEGPLVEAVMASTAVPGLFPPVRVGEEHFLDGGLVHSIPVGRALGLGVRTIFVLQVGRIEQPLTVPKSPLQVGLVAFEIARRHRFVEEMARLPEGVTVHVLPTGENPRSPTWAQQLRYRDVSRAQARIEQAFRASTEYLADRGT